MAAIKRYIRIFRRKRQQARTRRKANQYLIEVFSLTKCGTLSELDFSAGYYTGIVTKAAELGKITEQQRDEVLRVLRHIHKGEREIKENE